MLKPTFFSFFFKKKEVSVKEIYRQIIIPDILQLEQGIQVTSADGVTRSYVGSIHMIIGDHVELCDLAGIITGMYLYSLM